MKPPGDARQLWVRGAARAAMLSFLLIAAACSEHSDSVPDQLKVVVDAGPDLRESIASVALIIQKQGSLGSRTLAEVRFEPGGVRAWPLTVELAVDDGLAGTYRFIATGRDQQAAILAQVEASETIADDSEPAELHIAFEDPDHIDAAVSDVATDD
ncbi:MAG TPA: hypothetical protein VFG30_41950 [Polyangiales bacterium]|nr:hypothetical protein [Polyangiales bacterium]